MSLLCGTAFAIGCRSWRRATDHGENREVLSLRFCCIPMACLPLPVVRVSTWCFGCRLRNSRWHRLRKVKISWEVAQDIAEARGESTGAVLGLVFHARRCAPTGPRSPDSSVWRCRRCSSCGCGRPWAGFACAENCGSSAVAVLPSGRVPVVPVLFQSAGVEKTAELPHCSRRALDKVVDMPVCATTSAHGAVQQGCGRPCDHVVGSLAGGSSNSVHCQSLWAFSVRRDIGLSARFGDEGVGAHHTGDELN